MVFRALVIMALCGPGWAWAAGAADAELQKPITLDQALEIAFRRSPEIRTAQDEVRKAAGGVAEARANYRPKFSADLKHISNGPDFVFGEYNAIPDEASTASLSFFLPVDVSKGLWFVSEIARCQYELASLNLASVSQRLIFEVKRSYLDLLRAQGQQQVAQASVDVATQRLKSTRDRFAAGTVADFEVTRGEVEVANLNQTLIQAKARVVLSRAALNRVLGLDVDTPIEVVEVDIQVEERDLDARRNINQANTRRPEIRSAETAVLLSTGNAKLQATADKPSFGISWLGNYNTPPYGFTTGHTTWAALVELKVPIWDGGVTKAKVDQAEADVAKSRNGLAQAKLAVALEVQTAVVGTQEAAERVRTAAANVQLAEKALRLANDRYDSGLSILVEVADAESALTLARFNAVQARYDYAVAVAGLERATSTQPEALKLQLLGDSAKRGGEVHLETAK